jgi:hypothetical protein
MGSSTTTVHITAETAEKLRAEAQTAPRDRWSYRPSFEDLLLTEAVQTWRDEEANRHDNARAGAPLMLTAVAPAMKVEQFHAAFDDNLDASIIQPILSDDSVVAKTRTLTVEVRGELIAGLRRGDFQAQRQLRAEVLAVVPASELGDLKVVTLPAPRKPVAQATEGRAETKYRITGVSHSYNREVNAILNQRFDSMSQARLVAVALMDQHPELPDLSIEGGIVRDSQAGRKLVTVTRPAVDGKVKVEVTTHTLKAKQTIVGYDVTFWYGD